MNTWDKKYNDKGEVAVLYSPGYGAGWYTWSTGEEQALFDSRIVDLVLADKQDQIHEEFMKSIGLKGSYTGGAGQLQVEWIKKGTLFKIDEYDGSESIEYKEDEGWAVA